MPRLSVASTTVLEHLHDWQRRAGIEPTWPTLTRDAYTEQWRAIDAVLELEQQAPA